MNRPLILGCTGAIIGAAALTLTYFVDREPSKEAVAVLKAPAPSPGAGIPVSDTPRRNVALTTSGEAIAPTNSPPSSDHGALPNANTAPDASTSKVPGRSEAPQPKSPSFDVVRVNPRGDAVIAGRAQPNARVTVRDGQTEIGTARADARGEWVVVPKEPLPAGSRELTLSSKSRVGEAIQSKKNVVIVVPKREKSAPSGSLAVLVPRDGKGESVVMQKPSDSRRRGEGSDTGPAAVPLSIDAVDYDESGNVTISGSATAGERLHIYIENKFAGSGKADKRGRWRLVPGGALPPGLYTLRVDQVDQGGNVLGRAETQFTRAKPVGSSSRETVIFVEPGNSLWRIARRIYGSGVQYTVIFDANREQIRNPDLIYPGQVFFVPHVN